MRGIAVSGTDSNSGHLAETITFSLSATSPRGDPIPANASAGPQ
jgi:hypothetical protein